jgi:RimJ/RimL family protein N-acetyltransferase
MAKHEIYIRALEIDDYVNINKWHKDKKVYSRITANKYYIAEARDKEWIKKVVLGDPSKMYWAICLKESDEMMGYMSLYNIDWRNKKADVGGITIGREYQNLGLGLESMDVVLKYIFYDFGLRKLFARYLETHLVTAHSIKKFGYKEEILFREDVYKLGKYHNVIGASILKKDFIPLEQQKSK